MWPENWKKGQRPVNAETGGKHTCTKEKKGFVHYNCPQCNRDIYVKKEKLDLAELCTECTKRII